MLYDAAQGAVGQEAVDYMDGHIAVFFGNTVIKDRIPPVHIVVVGLARKLEPEPLFFDIYPFPGVQEADEAQSIHKAQHGPVEGAQVVAVQVMVAGDAVDGDRDSPVGFQDLGTDVEGGKRAVPKIPPVEDQVHLVLPDQVHHLLTLSRWVSGSCQAVLGWCPVVGICQKEQSHSITPLFHPGMNGCWLAEILQLTIDNGQWTLTVIPPCPPTKKVSGRDYGAGSALKIDGNTGK